MITKADFDKLKSKKVMPSVLAAENLMLAAWDVVEKSALGLSKANQRVGGNLLPGYGCNQNKV